MSRTRVKAGHSGVVSFADEGYRACCVLHLAARVKTRSFSTLEGEPPGEPDTRESGAFRRCLVCG